MSEVNYSVGEQTTIEEIAIGDFFVADEAFSITMAMDWSICKVIGRQGMYTQVISARQSVNRRKCADKKAPQLFFNVICGMPVREMILQEDEEVEVVFEEAK